LDRAMTLIFLRYSSKKSRNDWKFGDDKHEKVWQDNFAPAGLALGCLCLVSNDVSLRPSFPRCFTQVWAPLVCLLLNIWLFSRTWSLCLFLIRLWRTWHRVRHIKSRHPLTVIEQYVRQDDWVVCTVFISYDHTWFVSHQVAYTSPLWVPFYCFLNCISC